MIKVCHMSSAHMNTDLRIFAKECASLAKHGYDVTFIAQGESGEREGVRVIGIEKQLGGRLRRMTKTAKAVFDAAINVDAQIYHFHDAELFPYALKLKRLGKKVIFDSHEHTARTILEKSWLPKFIRPLIYVWFINYEKYVCRRLDGIVSVTTDLTEYFKTINKNVAEVTNFPIFSRQVIMPDFSKRQLVFAGGIQQEWNHHRVISLLEKIPDCGYLLCGSGKDAYMQSLQNLAGWKKVNYLGRIPQKEVANVLSSGYIGLALITPNRNTGWKTGTMGNNKIFEEMMAGLPIICTDFVLWKEFVQRWNCGICVDPENDNEIINAINYLLDNPEEAKKMGENGRKAVEVEFNWSVEEKKLFALYDLILNKENA